MFQTSLYFYAIAIDLIPLQPADFLGAVGMMAIAVALSRWQRLGLERELMVATARTTVQLVVVGYLLWFVFDWKNPGAVLAVVAGMLAIATMETRNRIGKRIPNELWLLGGSMATSLAIVLTYTTVLVIRPAMWFDPQYLIPLAGIVLGNVMNGAALAGERLMQMVQTHRAEIETHLCLGATPEQAIAAYRKAAIRTGLIPTLNAMMVVGVVTLPGIMTGQLLSGINPLDAASYQMLIMFMLAFSTLLTTVLVVQGLAKQCFNAAAQLVLPL
ncbi:ABC transporter permease [Altericista sp. CCNU0014]|uniref:ABC transporter permease n=1 Tax=Altericista sp. CCNU0014 TaxID=3082949 RepID=UPI00384F775B